MSHRFVKPTLRDQLQCQAAFEFASPFLGSFVELLVVKALQLSQRNGAESCHRRRLKIGVAGHFFPILNSKETGVHGWWFWLGWWRLVETLALTPALSTPQRPHP